MDAASRIAAAEEACLDSYADRAGIELDPARLHWQRGCAELHYLMLMLKKDGYAPDAFAAGVERLEAACDALPSPAGRH